VHAPIDDKCDDAMFSPHKERAFNQFPKYPMRILLRDFNEKVEERRYLKTDNWE
jgi:hypothetical protein